MNSPKENIKSLIARIATIGLFAFILFLSKSPECTNTRVYDHYVVNVHVSDADTKAIPCQIAYPPNPANSIVSCEISTLNTCNNNNFRIISSNQEVDQLLKKCREEFLLINPLILDFDLFHIRSSASTEIPLIS